MIRKGLVIYEPKGMAKEYSPLAVNLYRGCQHGCVYCYAPDTIRVDRQQFSKAIPRDKIIQRLTKDAPKAAADGATGNVLLCFTCDPYQPLEDIYHLTHQAIPILHSNGFNVTILTKGGQRAERDFDLYQPGDEFAATLTFMDWVKSYAWEPEAAAPAQRIATLRKAHYHGIKTWVSLEPVIDPAETLEIIRQTHSFVDFYKVGTLNNHPEAANIDWPQFAKDVVVTLKEYDCKYYLKNDLRKYL